jgi:hypothetical protein
MLKEEEWLLLLEYTVPEKNNVPSEFRQYLFENKDLLTEIRLNI